MSFVVALVGLLAYRKVFQGFFQQDEWLAFGFHYLLRSQGFGNVLKNAFFLRAGHYSPFNLILEHFLFNFFGLSYHAWAINSLAMHFLNSILVFVLAKLLFKDFKKAVLSSLVFVVMASSFQATAWTVADIGTHQSTFFALLCFIFFFQFMDEKKYLYFGLSFVSLLVSLLFKETAVALFALLPAALLLFDNKTKNESRLKISLFTIIFGAVFMSLRFLAFLIPQEELKGTIYEQAPSVSESFSPGKFVYNLATFPVKGVSQSLVPVQVLLTLSDKAAGFIPRSVAGQPHTTNYDIFVQKYVLEAINFVVFVLVTALAIRSKRIGVFLLLFMMANTLVYSFSPERIGRITILDSRNLYFISAGSAMFIVEILASIFAKSKIKLYFACVLLVAFNLYLLNSSLTSFVVDGKTRKSILESIRNEYPSLPQKVIFYTESDTSFYGLPKETKIMPFQSGFGQTLAVWYYPKERFPAEFLKKKYLWEITDQGYQEVGGRGFGYFREYEKLKEAMIKNKLNPDSVIAYRYNSQMNGLTDITAEIRDSLKRIN